MESNFNQNPMEKFTEEDLRKEYAKAINFFNNNDEVKLKRGNSNPDYNTINSFIKVDDEIFMFLPKDKKYLGEGSFAKVLNCCDESGNLFAVRITGSVNGFDLSHEQKRFDLLKFHGLTNMNKPMIRPTNTFKAIGKYDKKNPKNDGYYLFDTGRDDDFLNFIAFLNEFLKKENNSNLEYQAVDDCIKNNLEKGFKPHEILFNKKGRDIVKKILSKNNLQLKIKINDKNVIPKYQEKKYEVLLKGTSCAEEQNIDFSSLNDNLKIRYINEKLNIADQAFNTLENKFLKCNQNHMDIKHDNMIFGINDPLGVFFIDIPYLLKKLDKSKNTVTLLDDSDRVSVSSLTIETIYGEDVYKKFKKYLVSLSKKINDVPSYFFNAYDRFSLFATLTVMDSHLEIYNFLGKLIEHSDIFSRLVSDIFNPGCNALSKLHDIALKEFIKYVKERAKESNVYDDLVSYIECFNIYDLRALPFAGSRLEHLEKLMTDFNLLKDVDLQLDKEIDPFRNIFFNSKNFFRVFLILTKLHLDDLSLDNLVEIVSKPGILNNIIECADKCDADKITDIFLSLDTTKKENIFIPNHKKYNNFSLFGNVNNDKDNNSSNQNNNQNLIKN